MRYRHALYFAVKGIALLACYVLFNDGTSGAQAALHCGLGSLCVVPLFAAIDHVARD